MIAHHYTMDTPTCEPVEIRCGLVRVGETEPIDGHRYSLIASERNGVISATMTNTTGGGYDQSLSNLQPTTPQPHKAVAGWQLELIEWVDASLYTVIEVR